MVLLHFSGCEFEGRHLAGTHTFADVAQADRSLQIPVGLGGSGLADAIGLQVLLFGLLRNGIENYLV